MNAFSSVLNRLPELLTQLQTSPLLLIGVVALGALFIAGMAIRLAHAVVSKK